MGDFWRASFIPAWSMAESGQGRRTIFRCDFLQWKSEARRFLCIDHQLGAGDWGIRLKEVPKLFWKMLSMIMFQSSGLKKIMESSMKEIDKDLDLFEIDLEATEQARSYIRNNRKQWLVRETYKRWR